MPIIVFQNEWFDRRHHRYRQHVGIGTTSPERKLHVSIGAGVDGDILVLGQGLNAGEIGAEFGMVKSSGNGALNINVAKQGTGYGTIGLQTSGGSVGIGTTSPTSALGIQYSDNAFNPGVVLTNTNSGSTSMSAFQAVNDSGSTAIMGVWGSNVGTYYEMLLSNAASFIGTNGMTFQTDNSVSRNGTDSIYFQTGRAGNSPTLTITGGNPGNVGIGTTSPQAGLDIATTGTAASAMIVPRDTTTNRPSIPVNGMIRYNMTTTNLESYANGNWYTRAKGLMGKLTMAGHSSCLFSKNSTSWTTYSTANSNCNAATVSGGASAPTEGQIPAIKFATLPPGDYEVVFNVATMYGSSTSTDCNFRITDGTNFSGNVFSENEDISHMIGQFSYSSAQTNIEFYIQVAAQNTSNNCNVDLSLGNSYLEIWVKGI